MNIYAIGDLHLSGNPPTKPMNIFGPHWDNHWQRIKEHWLSTVTDEDIIFLVGDMSWALRLDEALYDLKEIASLPGQKFMIRGNHDYWWSSANKMKNAMGDAITFLQGHGTARIINLTTNEDSNDDAENSKHSQGESQLILAFGGTRGYICPDDASFEPDTDQSIYDREVMRTEAALQEMEHAIQALQKEHGETENTEEIHPVTRVLLLHYPPFNENNAPSGFTDLMERYHVDICIFGHLHDQNSFKRIPSTFGTTKLELVSADYAEFKIQKIL